MMKPIVGFVSIILMMPYRGSHEGVCIQTADTNLAITIPRLIYVDSNSFSEMDIWVAIGMMKIFPVLSYE